MRVTLGRIRCAVAISLCPPNMDEFMSQKVRVQLLNLLRTVLDEGRHVCVYQDPLQVLSKAGGENPTAQNNYSTVVVKTVSNVLVWLAEFTCFLSD